VAQIRGAGQIITSASKDDGIRILKEQYKIKDVINHATENVVDRVRELTQGQGVDIAYDSTYIQSSYTKSIETVKAGGSWIVLKRAFPTDGEEAKNIAKRKAKLVVADVSRYWLGSERTQLKSFIQKSLIEGMKWVQEGKLKPYINQIIKLEEAENALQQIRQGKGGFGKVVVKIISD
jgi:NADPH2:quinone reductase